jgi:hypothetical protein
MKSVRMGWSSAVRGVFLVAGLSVGLVCQAAGATASKTTLVAAPANQHATQSVTLTATVAPYGPRLRIGEEYLAKTLNPQARFNE